MAIRRSVLSDEFAALRSASRIVKLFVDAEVSLHPSVHERLTRPEIIGPLFFDSLVEQSSDLSDLRLRRATDQLAQLVAALRWNREAIPADSLKECFACVDTSLYPLMEPLDLQPARILNPDRQAQFVQNLAVADPDLLHQVLACYVDGLSAWSACAGWVPAIIDVQDDIPNNDEGGHLLAAFGSVQAAEMGCAFDGLFSASLERLNDSWDCFFVCLRWATAALKRSHDETAYCEALQRASFFAGKLGVERPEDGEFAKLLVSNLDALRLLRIGEFEQLLASCKETMSRSTECHPSLPAHVVDRYLTTFKINYAVVVAQGDDTSEAVRVLRETAAALRASDAGSLAEVLGFLALFLVRAGQPLDALVVLDQAVPIAASRGGVTQLREMCRVGAVANDEVGNDAVSQQWLAASNLPDPRQGLRLSSP